MIDIKQIKKEISKYDVISFDLFDTLIKRDCYKPTEIFYFIEQKVDQEFGRKSNFSVERMRAEIVARKKAKAEEVTIEEIYNVLTGGFSCSEKELIRYIEEECEYNLCQWNPLIKRVYDYCVDKGKRIFIVTDIYLPEELIQRILYKLEIRYDMLFVSSTIRKMKQNGSLFQYVLNESKITPDRIIHIGDNKKSDYLIPKKMGINAVLIPRNSKINLYYNERLYRKNFDYANLCSFINNHANTHSWDAIYTNTSFDFFSETGYEVQGPVLYGYVNWLSEQFRLDGIEKVFFLSRDGQLMQKAYEKLKNILPSTYMYASRKALIIPSLWMTSSISEISESIFWGRRGTIQDFLKKIGLNPTEFEKDFTVAGFSLVDDCEYSDLWQNPDFIEVFEKKVKQKMIANSYQMYCLLTSYLKQINFSGKVAVVDIGWYGHMQNALEKVIKAANISAEIHGYYLGLRPESPLLDHMEAKGYLFDKDKYDNFSMMEVPFNSIVEMLFTANHGTTKGYKEENGNIEPILGQWEYDNVVYKKDYNAIHACQEGALAFIDDMLIEKKYFLFKTDSIITFANWFQLGRFPSIKAATYFGNLHFLDDGVKTLAKPRLKFNYLIHPIILLCDLRDSLWRMGFFTRVFGTWFPYALCYETMKNIYIFLIKILHKR